MLSLSIWHRYLYGLMAKVLTAYMRTTDCGSNPHEDPQNTDAWRQVCLHLFLKLLLTVKLLITFLSFFQCHSFCFEQKFDYSYEHENLSIKTNFFFKTLNRKLDLCFFSEVNKKCCRSSLQSSVFFKLKIIIDDSLKTERCALNNISWKHRFYTSSYKDWINKDKAVYLLFHLS